MQRRLFDPRVGYFTDDFTLFSDNQQRVEPKRFITRWRLEPKDSADAELMKRGILVEPRKPIVYYIDPATPKQWRPYLIQGVNDWQKAFEQAAGFLRIPGAANPLDASAVHPEAYPVAARILERLPATATVIVRIEVADEAEEQALQTQAQLDLKWLHRNGADAGTTTLLIDAVKDAAPVQVEGQRIFAWAGCEFDAFKAIRSFWRKECGLKREEHMAVAYWRRGVAEED